MSFTRGLLAGDFGELTSFFGFLDDAVLFGDHHFNVAWEALVWTDATVGTVRASAHFRCALARHMLDGEVCFGQVLVFRVGLGVPEQVKEGLRSLLRPTAFITWGVPLLTLISEGNILSQNKRNNFISTAEHGKSRHE